MKKSGKLILGILLLVVLAGAGTFGYYQWEESQYYTTDNAKVMADLKNVTATTGGEVVKWNVESGSKVAENEVIGRLSNGYELKSPIEGIIVKSNVVLNQMITSQTVVATVADVNHAYILVNVEETDIANIKLGQSAIVNLDAFSGKKFSGHVEEIDNVTVAALSGNATSFTTSGTYNKVTQLIPVKVFLDDEISLTNVIGTNAYVKIDNQSPEDLNALKNTGKSDSGKFVDATGIVTAKRSQNIVLNFSAKVKAVNVLDGQKVKAGDVILSLDMADINKQIGDLKRNIETEKLQLKKIVSGSARTTASENLARAKEDLNKQAELYKAGLVTQEVFETYQRKVDDLTVVANDSTKDFDINRQIQEQKIKALEESLKTLRNYVEKPYLVNQNIVSDYENGLVQGISLISGDVISPNTVVANLVDLNSLVIDAEVSEHQIKNVKVGSVVEIVPIYDTDKVYKGKVSHVSSAGVVKNGETVVNIEVTVENGDGTLMPNFNVDLKITK